MTDITVRTPPIDGTEVIGMVLFPLAKAMLACFPGDIPS
jgi:hypothetical protein